MHYVTLASLFSQDDVTLIPLFLRKSNADAAEAEHHINASQRCWINEEKQRNKKSSSSKKSPKRAKREHKPERILIMTQLYDNQVYVEKY